METAIVTIKTRNGQFERDAELPADLPVSTLSAKLLETLKNLDHHTFASLSVLSLSCNGKMLDKEKTLNELGIWDGSIIIVQ